MQLAISRGMVQTALGAIGYLICDGTQQASTKGQPPSLSNQPELNPILCFHGSPRSSDEFLEVLPLLAKGGGDDGDDGSSTGKGRKVIAIDTPGYGISENPKRSCSMDDIADAMLEVAEALGIGRFVTIGSLMGNFQAVSLASRHPNRVVACICANLYYFPQTKKDGDDKGAENDETAMKQDYRHDVKGTGTGEPIVDSFELKEDGSHLLGIHTSRKWLDDELNFRVVQSEVTYLVNRRRRYAEGISIEDLSEYNFEVPSHKVVCPVLCIEAEAGSAFFDMIGYEGTQRFQSACQLLGNDENGQRKENVVQVETLTGPKSSINCINQMPDEFVTVCNNFLQQQQK